MIQLMMYLFGIMTVVMGVWGFSGWSPETQGSALVMFWMCLGVFVMLVIAVGTGTHSNYWRRRPER